MTYALVDKQSTIELCRDAKLAGAGEVDIILAKAHTGASVARWNRQVALGVSYGKIKAAAKFSNQTRKTTWVGADESMVAYALDPGAGMEDGGLEIELILKKKPPSNRFDFQLNGWEYLDFFKQKKMTAAEIAAGGFQPENIPNSYAVYHKTLINNILGRRNYGAGKAFHIFRPKITDADGKGVWGDLNYANGVLTVIVPAAFLNTAKYPVVVDPTFGNTAIGASTATSGAIIASRVELTPEAGTITSIDIHCQNADVTPVVAAAVFDNNGVIPDILIADDDGNVAVPAVGATVQVPLTLVFASGIQLWLTHWGSTSGHMRFYDGTGDSTQQKFNNGGTFDTFPTPFFISGTQDRRVTIFVTYIATPVGGGGGRSLILGIDGSLEPRRPSVIPGSQR